MNITQFTMEEVRCFAERQEFEIRPLTFLVGENSTGKTTALACFQVLANYLRGEAIDFNSDPGILRNIVRNSKKTQKAFTLGFTLRWPGLETDPVEYTVEFIEKKEGVKPVVRSITVKFTDGEIVLRASDIMNTRLAYFDKEQNRYHIDVSSDLLVFDIFISLAGRFPIGEEGQSEGEKAFRNYFSNKRIRWFDVGDDLAVFSFSPIRSHPKPAYNPTRVFDDPEGSDVPQRLMEVKAIDKKRWETLKAQLVEFGKCSDLFQNIDVRHLGRSRGDPFQLKVKVRGPNANIIDVGYGVSQILPILVDILDPPTPHLRMVEMPFFLLQQPEVHLHPRAQAELSSLLATLASEGNRAFIVETHSDYMIDRARVEIRKGNIRPEDVSLIYLEPKRNVVKVHNISFDKMGNMEGVPPHYREFFMTEYRQLMGFED